MQDSNHPLFNSDYYLVQKIHSMPRALFIFSMKMTILLFIFLLSLGFFSNETCIAHANDKTKTERRKKRLKKEYVGNITIWTHHLYLTASNMNQNGTVWTGSKVRDIPIYFIQKGDSGEIYRLRKRFLKNMISDNQDAVNALHQFNRLQHTGEAYYAATTLLAGAGAIIFPKNIAPLKMEHLPKIGGAILLGVGSVATYCIARVAHHRSKIKLKEVVDIYNGIKKPTH